MKKTESKIAALFLMILCAVLSLPTEQASATSLSDDTVFAQKDGDDIVIGKYRKFYSIVLGEERTFYAHLPKDYESTSMRYPVIYLLYCNDPEFYYSSAVATMYPLCGSGKIPGFILVGVSNTGQRYRDYLPVSRSGGAGGADNFARFFKEELIPYIDKNYRTQDYRIIVGPQSSAVFGVYSLLKYPDLFNTAIVSNPFNPSWRSTEVLINLADSVVKNNSSFKKFLYITYYDSEAESFDSIKRFDEIISKQKPDDFRYYSIRQESRGDFFEDVFLKESLKALFDKFEIPPDCEVSNLNDLKRYYENISKVYGFQADIPDMAITFKAGNLIDKWKMDEAKEMFEYSLKMNPRDSNAIYGLSRICSSIGDLETAVMYYEKLLDMNPDEVFFKESLERAKRQISGSAAYIIEKIINASGSEAAVEKFRKIKNDSSNKLYFDEREFNALGYKYIARKMLDAALEVFKINTELYPASANAFDSLAEVHMIKGDKELAIKYYQKSLELNPKNENAEKKLKELMSVK